MLKNIFSRVINFGDECIVCVAIWFRSDYIIFLGSARRRGGKMMQI
jgi:hypothetical protein